MSSSIWVRSEKDHLTPEVKMANEKENVTMYGISHTPIYVTHSKWYIRKALFVLEVQSLDANPLSHFWPA
jgi:hypothetical protein